MAMTEEAMVIGVFRDHALAEQAIDELRHAGFRNDQINLLGHTSGNALGGVLNLFSRKSTTPDTVAAAPNELAGSGIAQEDMPFYQRELEAGNFVVTVQPYGHQKEASDILYRHGAYDASADTTRMGSGNRVVPIREERLQVNKQVVQIGEVIIHKRVITENKTFTIPVTREEVTIERLPAKGSPDAAPTTATARDASLVERRPTSDQAASPIVDGGEMLKDGGTIRILVREEQVTLNKQLVVVEEIVVRKQQIQETRELSDTVKHEEVHVEHTGNVIIHDAGMDAAL
ncbi:MAG: YsnF/AvaK domain-containing protein [Ktedonobacteraceae bacterium]